MPTRMATTVCCSAKRRQYPSNGDCKWNRRMQQATLPHAIELDTSRLCFLVQSTLPILMVAKTMMELLAVYHKFHDDLSAQVGDHVLEGAGSYDHWSKFKDSPDTDPARLCFF
ncbi:uncharacterized protein PV06_09589 [Exophiala oligosperma]|uniref:Uncharacterized protein n=1 Tax=Exophiala oligosperma TaxID=215243 RepID=A0A0D2AEP8_9EURO|nr:uncharacterized protein PV06_09589 [Exophiala oligosperma]KIW38636.1 hypothetical protein PV06_09589 [Exophiala oligosperma]